MVSDRRTRKWGDSQAAAAVQTLRVDVTEGTDVGRSVWGERERLTVGTAQGNDLILGDETVSRYHLEPRRTGDVVEVVSQ